MHVLITGATGFVGTHLCTYLLRQTDWQILGTAFPDPPPASENPRLQFCALDARQQDAVHALMDAYRP
ncbi:MAG: NAD(P)-dependent oxidoreductase [Anaerolineae bacterium]|nr:NAD(P)-dependent oxidoreductase [Anaerolineae bacterium]